MGGGCGVHKNAVAAAHSARLHVDDVDTPHGRCRIPEEFATHGQSLGFRVIEKACEKRMPPGKADGVLESPRSYEPGGVGSGLDAKRISPQGILIQDPNGIASPARYGLVRTCSSSSDRTYPSKC